MTTARQPQANLADQLSLHARQRPTKPALVHGQQVLDYRTLELAVRQRAARLLDLGVQPGQIVGIALRDSMEHVLMLWAVTRAGAESNTAARRRTPAKRCCCGGSGARCGSRAG